MQSTSRPQNQSRQTNGRPGTAAPISQSTRKPKATTTTTNTCNRPATGTKSSLTAATAATSANKTARATDAAAAAKRTNTSATRAAATNTTTTGVTSSTSHRNTTNIRDNKANAGPTMPSARQMSTIHAETASSKSRKDALGQPQPPKKAFTTTTSSSTTNNNNVTKRNVSSIPLPQQHLQTRTTRPARKDPPPPQPASAATKKLTTTTKEAVNRRANVPPPSTSQPPRVSTKLTERPPFTIYTRTTRVQPTPPSSKPASQTKTSSTAPKTGTIRNGGTNAAKQPRPTTRPTVPKKPTTNGVSNTTKLADHDDDKKPISIAKEIIELERAVEPQVEIVISSDQSQEELVFSVVQPIETPVESENCDEQCVKEDSVLVDEIVRSIAERLPTSNDEFATPSRPAESQKVDENFSDQSYDSQIPNAMLIDSPFSSTTSSSACGSCAPKATLMDSPPPGDACFFTEQNIAKCTSIQRDPVVAEEPPPMFSMDQEMPNDQSENVLNEQISHSMPISNLTDVPRLSPHSFPDVVAAESSSEELVQQSAVEELAEEKIIEKPIDLQLEPPKEQAAEQTIEDQTSERPIELPVEHVGEEPIEKPIESIQDDFQLSTSNETTPSDMAHEKIVENYEEEHTYGDDEIKSCEITFDSSDSDNDLIDNEAPPSLPVQNQSCDNYEKMFNEIPIEDQALEAIKEHVPATFDSPECLYFIPGISGISDESELMKLSSQSKGINSLEEQPAEDTNNQKLEELTIESEVCPIDKSSQSGNGHEQSDFITTTPIGHMTDLSPYSPNEEIDKMLHSDAKEQHSENLDCSTGSLISRMSELTIDNNDSLTNEVAPAKPVSPLTSSNVEEGDEEEEDDGLESEHSSHPGMGMMFKQWNLEHQKK